MSCNYYNGKCIFLNGKVYEEGCIACPIKRAYDKGVIDTKKDYERPHGEWTYTTHHSRRYRVCPLCGVEKEDDHATGWNFCQYCGAMMQKEGE